MIPRIPPGSETVGGGSDGDRFVVRCGSGQFEATFLVGRDRHRRRLVAPRRAHEDLGPCQSLAVGINDAAGDGELRRVGFFLGRRGFGNAFRLIHRCGRTTVVHCDGHHNRGGDGQGGGDLEWQRQERINHSVRRGECCLYEPAWKCTGLAAPRVASNPAERPIPRRSSRARSRERPRSSARVAY